MTMKFTEAQLENAIIQLLGKQGYPHVLGGELERGITDVLIEDDLRSYLTSQYADVDITANEVNGIIRQLALLSPSDLYDSNKTFCKWLSDALLPKHITGELQLASNALSDAEQPLTEAWA